MKRSLCFLLLVLAPSLRADNWPTWRGPTHDGVCAESGLDLTWGEKRNLLWKIPMPGRGGATPVIWGDRLFLTSGDGDDQVLLCFGTDGKQRWRAVVGSGGRRAIKGDEANEASASPTTDGKHVWAFVGTGHLACYDVVGKEIWKVDIQKEYGTFKIQHGLHTTPVVDDRNIYLSLLHSNGHWVVARDKHTGKEAWKVARPSDARDESKEAYASPCLWNDGKSTVLVILGADYATGHRLDDGKEVWRVTHLNPKTSYSAAFRIISSPVASRGVLIVPTCRGQSVVALKPGAAGRIEPGTPGELWRVRLGSPDVPSPLVHQGLVYLCRENGVLQCWDAATGKEIYKERLHVNRYRASPVAVDGRLIVPSRDGNFSIVQAGKKFQLLHVNGLDDVFTASPAIADGNLYLRGFQHLYAFDVRGKK